MKHNPIQHFAPQGTKEWATARAGMITASRFNELLTPAKLEPSKSVTPYLYELAGETLLGGPASSFQSAAMDRGKEFEPEARDYFDLTQGREPVEEAGLIYLNEDRRIACSPDGLIGADEGLELKCPEIKKHVTYLMAGVCPPEYWHQVQGCLYVTGRKVWHFMSYYPGLPPLVVEVLPDERYHAALDVALPLAVAELDKIIARLRALEVDA